MTSSVSGVKITRPGKPMMLTSGLIVLNPGRGERFPMAAELEFRWSGQVMEPVDGLAFIGRNPGDKNIYVATGESGNGMTHGTIAGVLLTDLLFGRKNEWESLYDPSRISLRAASDFAKRTSTSGSVWRLCYRRRPR